MGLFDWINQVRGAEPELNEDEMRHVMDWMRQNRWTVSDTPGMGNVPAWSIKNAARLAPSGYGYPLDKEFEKREKGITRNLLNLNSGAARREAEQLLMDSELGGTMEMWDRRKPGRRGMLPVHHEQSETVPGPDGKWINVYGRNTPRAGQQLPNTGVYDTVEEAVQAARERSESQGMIDGTMYPRRTPRRNRHGGGGVRG